MAKQRIITQRIKEAYPGYSAPLNSACNHSEKTGVMRTPKAQRIYREASGEVDRSVHFRVPAEFDWESFKREKIDEYGSLNTWFNSINRKWDVRRKE